MPTLIGFLSASLPLLPFPVYAAIPSPAFVNSDLSILTHNDLYGSISARQAAAIVLSTRQSQSNSQSSCATLGETLFDPPSNGSQSVDFLRYLDYGKVTTDIGQFWIASSSNSTCRAITTHGGVETHPCSTRLPALCSNSAPLGSKESADTGLKWQTSVTTGNASILGYRDRHSFRFLGIKYGTIPARFENSKYLVPSPGSNISALSYGPACIQAGCDAPTCSEDCLFLNIWTPYLPQSKSASRKKAVMVWIHGGGFTGGSGSDTTFDGGSIASRGDVVLVTINYRLSTLGFLALSNSTLRGNYGLVDQNTALDWLRAHVEDFGGDKDRITVFGQSAGAASVRALLASPDTKGKFSGAIMQSNPAGAQYASTYSKYLSIAEATDLTKGILTELNCTQTSDEGRIACLRKQNPLVLQGFRETSTSYTGTIAKYPVIDGTYLTSDGLLLSESAPKLDITLMTGIMHDDGGPFSAFSSSPNATQALVEQGFNAADILGSNAFPLPTGSNTTLDIFNLTARVATDAEFRCLGQATAFSAAQNRIFSNVYWYEFDRAYQISEWSPNPPTCEAPITPGHPFGNPSQPFWKCHSGELYYVFGTMIRQGRQARDQDDIPFAQYTVDTWTSFARTKDPNPDLDFLYARAFTNTTAVVRNSSPWKPVEADNPKVRVLDVAVTDEGFRELAQCEVLDFPLDYYAR